MTQRPWARAWLSEQRRSGVSLLLAAVTAGILYAPLRTATQSISLGDKGVLVVLAYLTYYLIITAVVFTLAAPAQIDDWARRVSRGTFLQRYVLGSAPGPGVSTLISAAALLVAMLWLPGIAGTSLPDPVRMGVAVALVVIAWICVVVSFAVTFYADNLVEGTAGLDFPGKGDAQWMDYIYFAVSVMTTFGTTDVTVSTREMRRTVAANALIAFVFNTVTVATVMSVLNGG